MVKRKTLHSLILSISIYVIVSAAPAAYGQTGKLQIDYTVAVASIGERLFHVTADIKNVSEPQLTLSLPTWTPGWYTVENYFRNVLRFKITDQKGEAVPFVMTRKQTWRVDTRGRSRVKVEFDYFANVLALNQARIDKDFAFFTGTQLFIEAAGHRNGPFTVRFQAPQGWKIMTALKETADPMVFTASDYDTLVDAPTEMGLFDVTPFKVSEKQHYLVTTPAGAFSKENSARYTEMLTRVAQAQGKIYGGLPYDKYIHFYFFAQPESNAGGALEHLNSYVAFARPERNPTPDNLIGTASHEFFHLWNVKRLRPADMWPYDYSREQETPLLWVSEGLTSYYGDVALVRAGIRDRNWLLNRMGQVITGVETNEARNYLSPANSSTSTWIGYDSFIAFEVSYYTSGENLGALLDISILNDTDGRAGLDEVMRGLYNEFYLRGKGFTTDDMITVINRITGRDYKDFFRRYVWGVEIPPYEMIYGYAGLRAEKSSHKVPVLGVDFELSDDGELRITQVTEKSPAASAGLMTGDTLQAINDAEVKRGVQLNAQPGQSLKLTVKRGEETKVLSLVVGSRDEAVYRIVESPTPTSKQLKVREAWLKTTP